MEQTPQSAIRNPHSFELRPAEILTPINFRESGRKFRVLHVFRAPSFEDWLEYEQRLQRSVEIVGNATRFDRHEAEAAEALWDRLVLRVEGYLIQASDFRLQTSGESGSSLKPESRPAGLMSAFPDGWREKVDVLHKIAAVRLLAQVYPSPDSGEERSDEGSAAADDYFFDPDRVEVRLVAARNGVECDGLLHALRRPTAREQKEFSRVASSALYVRGSRTEKSLLPSRLREFVKFYDSLIQEVRGYLVTGIPAAREDAVKFMDALHKQTAVSALFTFEEQT